MPKQNQTFPATIRPALVIGLGGSGHQVVLRLKALLLSLFPPQALQAIRLLVFDTDDEALSVRLGDQTVQLERETEFFYIGGLAVSRIVRHLDNLPSIAERLPVIRDLPAVTMRHGAKQIRPLGLLSLLWHYPNVQQVVRDHLWALADRENLGDEHLRVDIDQGFPVFVVSSLVGGTGAGQFLDVAYLVRSELEALGTMGEACRVIGVGLLPGAFRNVPGANVVPNAIAALRELDHSMVQNSFRATYRNGHQVHTAAPPFDLYYLVDAVDEQGHTWLSREDLSGMVAQALYLMSGSPLGQQSDSIFTNLVHEVLAGRTPEGHGTFFGSFGVAELVFPAEALARLAAARHAQEMIEQVLLRAAQQSATTSLSEQLCRNQGLTPDALLTNLAVDEDSLPITVELEPPAMLSHVPDHQVPQETLSWLQSYRRVRVDGDVRRWITTGAETLAQRAVADLQARVREIVNDPGRGLRTAVAALDGLTETLTHTQRELHSRHEAFSAERRRRQGRAEDEAAGLLHAIETPWPLRGRRVAQARAACLEAHQALFETQVRLWLTDRAEAVVGRVREQAEAIRNDLKGLVGRLALSAEAFARETVQARGQLARERGLPALALVDDAYADQLYERLAPDVGATADRLLRDGASSRSGLLDWCTLSVEALQERVRAVTAVLFDTLYALDIETILQERTELRSPEAWCQALLDLARPAWNLDLTRMPQGGAHLASVEVLGVPDRESSLFRRQNDTLVSTRDSHRLVAFAAKIGAAYTTLERHQAYQRAYEAVCGGRPLHVLPAFQAQEQVAKLALGLGTVFGLIETRGSHFYYQSADRLEAPFRLGQGVNNAITTLRRQRGLARELVARAEAHIEVIGLAEASERLDRFCTPDDRDDQVTRELKKLVRAYAETLRNTQHFGRWSENGRAGEGVK